MQCAVRRWGKQKTFLLHSGTPAGPEERGRNGGVEGKVKGESKWGERT